MGSPPRQTGYNVPASQGFAWRVVLGTLLLTGAVLVILPISQVLSGDPRDQTRIVQVDAVIPPPDPPPPDPPPPPEEEPPQETPELEQPPPMMDISMIESMLNPTAGGFAAGGFDFSRMDAQAEVEEALIFSIRDLDRTPRIVRGGNITWPPEVQREGVVGRPRVVVRINPDGFVSVIDILDSPHPAVTEAIRRQMPTWRYESPTRDGEAVTAQYIQPFEINFRQ